MELAPYTDDDIAERANAMSKYKDTRFRSIRVLWRKPYTLELFGIPYLMRPGQTPNDLYKASEEFPPSKPGTYGTPVPVDLSDWINFGLGLPGHYGHFYGSLPYDSQIEFEIFLKSIPTDSIPNLPGEWSVL